MGESKGSNNDWAAKVVQELTAERDQLREEVNRLRAEAAELRRALEAAQQEVRDKSAIAAERDCYLQALEELMADKIADMDKNGLDFGEVVAEIEQDFARGGFSMANNSAASYNLALSGAQRQQLTTWAKRAVAVGKTAEYLAALRTIHRQLTTEPLVWGEPWFRLSQLGLLVHHRACPPLHVSYAVDSARRIVYIVKFTLFSGSGLEDDE